jgi:hypothetical protein
LAGLVWRFSKQKIKPFPNWILVPFDIYVISLDLFKLSKLFGVEAGVAFFVHVYCKSLEVKNTRDLLIVFNFALFVSASLLLHSQAFWMAVIVFSAFIMCYWVISHSNQFIQ